MSPEVITSVIVSALTGLSGVWAARAARRTPRQEKRDDFTVVTNQQGKAIERLEKRVEKGELAIEKQRERISDQNEAIDWLRSRLRDVVGYIRTRGEEPPAARPMSERAKRILNGIDV